MILRLIAFLLIVLTFVSISVLINIYTSVGNWSETWLLLVAAFKSLVLKLSLLLKTFFAWFIKTMSSIRLIEVVTAFLIIRFRRLFFVDLPYRVATIFAPYLTTNLKVRRLMRYRLGLLRKIFTLKARKYWLMIHVGLEPYCGQYTRMVIWLIVSLFVIVLLFFFTGLWLIVGFVPLPQPVRVFFSGVWQFMRGLIQPITNAVTQAIFRSTVFVVVGALWLRFISLMITEDRRRKLRLRRRQVIRNMFVRRKAAEKRIRKVSLLERFIKWKFKFWDRFFAVRVLPKLEALQAVPDTLKHLQVPVSLTNLNAPPCVSSSCCMCARKQ